MKSLSHLDASFRKWQDDRKRIPQIDAVLAEAIDLLALVMQAGLDFQVAMDYYLKHGTRGPLWDELALVQKEISLGASRVQALRHLIQRTPSEALKETARTLVQGIELGSSLAPLLRQQAQALRLKRAYAAEKQAAKAPLKLLFPLFVFIFPTIFAVLFGPMIITFMAKGGLP
jgi:tight adherence protein C